MFLHSLYLIPVSSKVVLSCPLKSYFYSQFAWSSFIPRGKRNQMLVNRRFIYYRIPRNIEFFFCSFMCFWGWIVTLLFVNPRTFSAEIQSCLLNRRRSITFGGNISFYFNFSRGFNPVGFYLFQYFINPMQVNVFWGKTYYFILLYFLCQK